MKILVTDTAGFIGFHMANKLLKDGHIVIGVDNINDYYDSGLKYDRLKSAGINARNAESNTKIQSEFSAQYYF